MSQRITLGRNKTIKRGLPHAFTKITKLIDRTPIRQYPRTFTYLWWSILWLICGASWMVISVFPTILRIPILLLLGMACVYLTLQPFTYDLQIVESPKFIAGFSVIATIFLGVILILLAQDNIFTAIGVVLQQPLGRFFIDTIGTLFGAIICYLWLYYKHLLIK